MRLKPKGLAASLTYRGNRLDHLGGIREVPLRTLCDDLVADLDLEDSALAGHQRRRQGKPLVKRRGHFPGTFFITTGQAIDDRYVGHEDLQHKRVSGFMPPARSDWR